MQQGKTVEQVIAAKPTADFDAKVPAPGRRAIALWDSCMRSSRDCDVSPRRRQDVKLFPVSNQRSSEDQKTRRILLLPVF